MVGIYTVVSQKYRRGLYKIFHQNFFPELLFHFENGIEVWSLKILPEYLQFRS
jgi:hypothetical protein